MNKDTRNGQHQRRQLIDILAKHIVDTAKPIVGEDFDEKRQSEAVEDIRQRLQFESTVALNELVTRYAPGRSEPTEEAVPERTFMRFGKNFRAQHMLMIVSVLILILTGIPLKFPEYGLSKFIIIDICGGLEHSTFIHRIGAVGLIIVGLWHLLYTFFSRVGWRDFVLMIPRPRDIIDFYQTIMYYFGRRATGAKGSRFTFIEKFDYWAVYWGMVIMICSGAILWFKEWFAKDVFDIAREMHSDEGLLATLAIVIWHFYNVHFNPDVFPMSWVWWHGNLTETEMKHHHPLEYAEIMEKESQEIKQAAEKSSAEAKP